MLNISFCNQLYCVETQNLSVERLINLFKQRIDTVLCSIVLQFLKGCRPSWIRYVQVHRISLSIRYDFRSRNELWRNIKAIDKSRRLREDWEERRNKVFLSDAPFNFWSKSLLQLLRNESLHCINDDDPFLTRD